MTNSLNQQQNAFVSSDGRSIHDLLLSTFLKFQQINNRLILQVHGLTQSTLADIRSGRSSTNERWVGRQLLDDKTCIPKI